MFELFVISGFLLSFEAYKTNSNTFFGHLVKVYYPFNQLVTVMSFFYFFFTLICLF